MLMRKAEQSNVGNKNSLNTHIQDNKSESTFSITDKQIEMFFNNWHGDLDELPDSFRSDIMRLSRPKKFKMHEMVTKFD